MTNVELPRGKRRRRIDNEHRMLETVFDEFISGLIDFRFQPVTLPLSLNLLG